MQLKHLLHILFLFPLQGTWLAAQPSTTDEASLVSFYGTVRNQAGQPAADCEVTFYSPWRDRWDRFSVVRYLDKNSPASVSVRTDSQGNYRVQLDTSLQPWLGAGHGSIFVRSNEQGWSIGKYQLSRGLVDLPLDFRLSQPTKVWLNLSDDRGQPIADAVIRPARIGDILIPHELSEQFHVTTNAQGRAEVLQLGEELQLVFVKHTQLGQHCTFVETDAAGEKTATLIRPITCELHFLPIDQVQSAEFPEINWTVASYTASGDKQRLSWQEFRTAAGQNSCPLTLPPGNLYIIATQKAGPELFAREHSLLIASDTNRVNLTLERGLHVTGKVVDAASGKPLSGITLMHFGKQHVVSNSDGTFAAWLPRLNDGFYPVDSLNRYFLVGSFYVRPGAESAPGEATVEPFEMVASTPVEGTVLSPDGNPLAGIEVRCQSTQERFTNINSFLTNRHGNFVISGLGAGTPVKLTVADPRGITPTPLEISIDAKVKPTIQLTPATAIRFVGRLVDDAGKPIAGADVSIVRAQTVIDNGYQPTDYTGVDAFNPQTVNQVQTVHTTTDNQGHFQTAQCFDTKHRFAVHVRHPSHFDKRTSYRSFATDEATAGNTNRYDFGDVQMRPVPKNEAVRVEVKDTDDQLVSGATVVLVQPGVFGGQAITGADGAVNFTAKHGPAVVGVSHPLLGTHFVTSHAKQSSAASKPYTIYVTLNKSNNSAAWPERQSDLNQRRAIAKQLLSRFTFYKKPELDQANYFEATTILGGMAFADPIGTIALAVSKRAELEKRGEIGQTLIFKIAQREPSILTPLMPLIPASLRANIYLNQARDLSLKPANRRTALEQAVTSNRQQQGDEAAVLQGQAAMLLIELGDIESAVELIEQFFEDYRVEATTVGGQRSKRGVARYFYPQLAMVDFELACKLIREQAYPNEIEGLLSLALVLAVMNGKTDWEHGLSQIGTTAFASSVDSIVPGAFGKTPLPTRQFVDDLAKRLTEPKQLGRLYIEAAMRLPQGSSDDRRELLGLAVQQLSAVDSPASTYYFESLAYTYADNWQILAAIDPAQARQLAFLCLRELSNHRDGQGDFLAERTALVAQALGHLDKQLSQVLLVPFVDDLTWRFISRDIGPILPLKIAAVTDPPWASQRAEALMDGEFKTDHLRQMLVVDTIVEGLSANSSSP